MAVTDWVAEKILRENCKIRNFDQMRVLKYEKLIYYMFKNY